MQTLPSRKDETWRYTALPVPGTAVAGEVLVEGAGKGVTVGRGEARLLFADADGVIALNRHQTPQVMQLHAATDATLMLQHIAAQQSEATTYTHVQLHVAAGAKVRLVETAVSAPNWLNCVTDIILEDGAVLEHVCLQTNVPGATLTRAVRVRVGAGATYKPFLLHDGAGTTRSHVAATILGEAAHIDLAAVQIAAPGSRLDLVTEFEHALGNASSNQLVRNVAADEGATAFTGRVVVARGADGTDAKQSCASLLLAPGAEANARPELKIWADDVKCAHGATVGELDPMQLFYLTSRGVTPADAKALLIEAFVAEPAAHIAGIGLEERVQAAMERLK